jgi:hypothetical protein
MKYLAAALALVTLAVSPALAVPKHVGHHTAAATSSAEDAYAADQGYGQDSVFVNGQYAGRDPDPNVRLELMRDQPSSKD